MGTESLGWPAGICLHTERLAGSVVAGPYESYAYGINDSGTVVGTTYDAMGQAHATIWSGSGTTILGAEFLRDGDQQCGRSGGRKRRGIRGGERPAPKPGDRARRQWSAAYGINNGGTIVGDGQLANGTFRGMVWNPDGSVTLLGTFGGNSSQANGCE